MPSNSQSAGHATFMTPNIDPPPTPPSPSPSSSSSSFDKVSAARTAVQHFLATELGAREVRITKLAPIDHGAQGWSAEAEILLPNLEIKTLGLDLAHEILEQALYLVELDANLMVKSYEYLSPSNN